MSGSGDVTVPPALLSPNTVEVTLGSGVDFTPDSTTVMLAPGNDAVRDVLGQLGNGGPPITIGTSDGVLPTIANVTVANIDDALNGTGPAGGTLQIPPNGWTLDLAYSDNGAINTSQTQVSANVTVNGVTAVPQDILRFDATALGSATIGTFSMYFDGSDVGFDDLTNEKIDSVKLLPDGRLLISTTGNPSVTGATTARDEDVLAFTPSSLGDITSGTWSMYFDGSDVGLSETSGEDVDALDVIGNTIYLSAQDVFSVSGVAGEDDDVFEDD